MERHTQIITIKRASYINCTAISSAANR